jgi:hypothetical protein
LEKLWKALEALGESGLEPKREIGGVRRLPLYRTHNKWVIVIDGAACVLCITRIP